MEKKTLTVVCSTVLGLIAGGGQASVSGNCFRSTTGPGDLVWCYVDGEKVDVSDRTFHSLDVKNEGGEAFGDNVTVLWGADSALGGTLNFTGSRFREIAATNNGKLNLTDSVVATRVALGGESTGTLHGVEMARGHVTSGSKLVARDVIVADSLYATSGSTSEIFDSNVGYLSLQHDETDVNMEGGQLRWGFSVDNNASLRLRNVIANTHNNANYVHGDSNFIMEGGQLIAGKGDLSYVHHALQVINSTARLDGVQVKGEVFVAGGNANATLDEVTLVTEEYAVSNNGNSIGMGAGVAVGDGARLEMNGGSITTLPPDNGDAIHVFKTGTASFNDVQIQSQRRGLWIYENAAATFNDSNITADAEVFLFSRGGNVVTMNDSTARSKSRAMYTKDGHNDVLNLINSTLEGDLLAWASSVKLNAKGSRLSGHAGIDGVRLDDSTWTLRPTSDGWVRSSMNHLELNNSRVHFERPADLYQSLVAW